MQIPDSVDVVYELQLPLNNTASGIFFKNREGWEELNGYLSLRRRPVGVGATM
jgi:hypothetical protein